MEIKKYFRKETTYEFVCECWQNSYAWGHKATMFINGYGCQVNKIRYYNRTWEMWTYQSVISGAIYKEIEQREKNLIENYKLKNNINRLSSKIKEQIINEDPKIQELKELKTSIGNGNRGGEF